MNSSPQNKEFATDPFAADIFAPVEETGKKSTELQAATPHLWSQALPKVTLPATDWNKLLNGLPFDFSDELSAFLAESLTQLLDLPEESPVELLFLVQREIKGAKEFVADARNSFWLTVGIEESAAEIIIEIDSTFAARLVDQMLDETSFKTGQIRQLTPSETAILEFLSLNLTFNANRFLQSPLFKLRSLSPEIPSIIRQNLESTTSVLLVVDWQIVNEYLSALVKIYFAPETLQALQVNENRLLDNRFRKASARTRLQNRIKEARLRIPCGTVQLSIAELAEIEMGDVVLLENYDFAVGGGNIFGRAEFLLGDGENAKITGEFVGGNFAFGDLIWNEQSENGDKIPVRPLNLKNDWQFVVVKFSNAENLDLSETNMAETSDNFTIEPSDENDEGTQNNLAVENLVVTLRVELEARRLTIAEISNLRENQILELGVRPTDAVNLFIDNQQIGRGELVTIEDRLGVRITKLLR